MNAYLQRGHEMMKKKKWNEAISDFEKYIELSKEDAKKCPYQGCQKCSYETGCRAMAMIDISVCMIAGGFGDALKQLLKATAECPNIREPWVYLAEMWFSKENYPQAYGCAMTALSIKDNGLNSKVGVCWGDYPQELANNSFSKILQLTKKI